MFISFMELKSGSKTKKLFGLQGGWTFRNHKWRPKCKLHKRLSFYFNKFENEWWGTECFIILNGLDAPATNVRETYMNFISVWHVMNCKQKDQTDLRKFKQIKQVCHKYAVEFTVRFLASSLATFGLSNGHVIRTEPSGPSWLWL